jgi:hypothetical protein
MFPDSNTALSSNLLVETVASIHFSAFVVTAQQFHFSWIFDFEAKQQHRDLKYCEQKISKNN